MPCLEYLLLSGNLLPSYPASRTFSYQVTSFLHALPRVPSLIRLTPPYLATVVVISTFANKLCDGPLCSYIIDQEKQSCVSYWWTNVLYINNLYPGMFKLEQLRLLQDQSPFGSIIIRNNVT
ncbi:unnamed protein product [Nezara viridula]|uniref:Uncharacterized protein n=1 Tax=Nezara viridula TaxID=85310 RepID=A0A9P0EA91_NEZVI|nr:unnamed protein product [Nezara viridula]